MCCAVAHTHVHAHAVLRWGGLAKTLRSVIQNGGQPGDDGVSLRARRCSVSVHSSADRFTCGVHFSVGEHLQMYSC